MITNDFVLSHRTAYYLGQRMIGRMAGDAICAAAQPTIAEWPTGKLNADGGLIDYTPPLDFDSRFLRLLPLPKPLKVPACDLGQWAKMGELLRLDSEETRGGDLGRSKIVTLTEALETGGLAWANYTQKALTKLRNTGTYRGFLSYKVFQHIAARNLARFSAECGLHIFGRYRPLQGPCFISTRNRKWIGKEDGWHCGRTAKHNHRGRPALSAAEVIRRQKAWNARRRKTRRPYVLKKRKPFAAPSTVFPRPERVEELRAPVIKREPKEMPSWLRKWAVKKGLDRMGLIDHGPRWKEVEKHMLDRYVMPVLNDSITDARTWFVDWTEACCIDLAARWNGLIPPNAEQISALLLPAMPAD